jgi:hypothetical protein
MVIIVQTFAQKEKKKFADNIPITDWLTMKL